MFEKKIAAPALPWNEEDRLQALASCNILDTPQEREYEHVVELVRQVVDVPMAAITLVDRNRVWLKAEAGLGVAQADLGDSVCASAILAKSLFVVPDLRLNPCFCESPFIRGGIIFYAGAPIVSPDGLPLGMICALGDSPREDGLNAEQSLFLETMAELISSKLHLRRMLNETTEALACEVEQRKEEQQVNKLKDDFISTVSHELRTPLTSIKGGLGLALSGALGEVSPKLDKILQIAQRNSERLVRLVNDLLDMDKLQSGKMEFDLRRTDVCRLLIEAREQTAPMADQHGSPIQVDVPEQALTVLADVHRLHQVLANLISNAAKFSPPGAAIRISARERPNCIRLTVADDGPGISPEFRRRLFERFAQADPLGATCNAPGTGLGLAITKHIIEAHGGEIFLDDRIAGGATFHIDLPLPQQR